MARLSKAEAARQLHISRTTLYKLIDQGKLSASPDGLIDTAELVRVLSTMNVHGERQCPPLDTGTQAGEHRERPTWTSSEREPWTSSERPLTSSYRDMVDILREQLQAAQERERDYREHIARLTVMLDQAHQQNQRLLDLPRSTPPPPREDTLRPRRAAPPPRGAMRQRIVALLQAHPEGLTPAEIAQGLGVERSLTDTVLGMVRYGLVQRVGYGRYVAAEPSRHDIGKPREL